MSYQEQKNIVSLISTVLISLVYFSYVYVRYQEEIFQSTLNYSFWGAVILLLILLSILAKIFIFIVFNIIYRIATKEEEPSFSDELDKLIELKATSISHYVFAIGFVLAMASLVTDVPPYVMFIILIFSGIVSDVVGNTVQLYLYRKGV